MYKMSPKTYNQCMSAGTKFLIVFIVAIIGYGAFMTFTKDRSFSIGFLSSQSSSQRTATSSRDIPKDSLVASVTQGIKSSLSSISSFNAQKAIADLGTEGEKLAADAVVDVKDSSRDFMNTSISNITAALRSALGTTSSTSSQDITVPPSLIGIVGGVGEKLSFMVDTHTVRASEPQVHVTIDWGEGGESVTADLSKDATREFSHAWSKSGDFIVKFSVTSSNAEYTYQAQVRIR